MIYISEKEEVVVNHLEPKEILDKLRYLCKGKTEPMTDLSDAFNIQTRDGRNMNQYSELLGKAIASIIEVKEHNVMDNFLNGSQTSFFQTR